VLMGWGGKVGVALASSWGSSGLFMVSRGGRQQNRSPTGSTANGAKKGVDSASQQGAGYTGSRGLCLAWINGNGGRTRRWI
jgi:hypothetical protein